MIWLKRLFRSTDADSCPDEAGALLERAIAEHRARRWQAAEPLFRQVVEGSAASPGDRQVARNILGNLLERNHRLDEAIELYEANVEEGFTGSYPYERLAAIYFKQGRTGQEVRVLRRAVAVVEQERASGREEVRPQIERLRARLSEVQRRR